MTLLWTLKLVICGGHLRLLRRLAQLAYVVKEAVLEAVAR